MDGLRVLVAGRHRIQVGRGASGERLVQELAWTLGGLGGG